MAVGLDGEKDDGQAQPSRLLADHRGQLHAAAKGHELIHQYQFWGKIPDRLQPELEITMGRDEYSQGDGNNHYHLNPYLHDGA